MYVDEQTYLEHYGVKGMKWGVRRYENERVRAAQKKVDYYKGRGMMYVGGTAKRNKRVAEKELSDARVEAKLNATKHKASDREKEIAKKLQREKKYTPAEARIAAYKQARMEKAALAIGGVAIGALGVYFGRKAFIKNVDSYIRAGTKLQNLNNHNPQELKQVFYATLKRSDKNLYKATYANNLAARGTVYNTTIGTKSRIKVASERSARKVMDDLMKNDSAFKANYKKALEGHINSPFTSPKRAKVYKQALKDLEAGKTNTKSLYDARNIFLVGRQGEIAANNAKFYAALKKKGYGALRDVNDMKYSGFKAKAPTIVFDTGKTYVKKSEVMPVKEIVERSNKRNQQMIRQAFLKETGKETGVQVGVTAAGTAGIMGVTKAKDDKAVRQYRSEHPNSKLSYNEILKITRKR